MNKTPKQIVRTKAKQDESPEDAFERVKNDWIKESEGKDDVVAILPVDGDTGVLISDGKEVGPYTEGDGEKPTPKPEPAEPVVDESVTQTSENTKEVAVDLTQQRAKTEATTPSSSFTFGQIKYPWLFKNALLADGERKIDFFRNQAWITPVNSVDFGGEQGLNLYAIAPKIMREVIKHSIDRHCFYTDIKSKTQEIHGVPYQVLDESTPEYSELDQFRTAVPDIYEALVENSMHKTYNEKFETKRLIGSTIVRMTEGRTLFTRRSYHTNIEPDLNRYFHDVPTVIAQHAGIVVNGVDLVYDNNMTGDDVWIGELLAADDILMRDLITHGATLADATFDIVQMILKRVVDVDIDQSTTTFSTLLSQFRLDANTPDLQEFVPRVASTDPVPTLFSILGLGILGAGKIKSRIPRQTDDLNELFGDLAYLVVVPPKQKDPETVRDILESIVVNWLSVMTKSSGQGDRISQFGPENNSTFVRSVNCFSGLSRDEGPLSGGHYTLEGFNDSTGVGPIPSLLKYDWLNERTYSHGGAPETVRGIDISYLYGDNHLPMVIQFLTALARARHPLNTRVQRILTSFVRVLSDTKSKFVRMIQLVDRITAGLQPLGFYAANVAPGTPEVDVEIMVEKDQYIAYLINFNVSNLRLNKAIYGDNGTHTMPMEVAAWMQDLHQMRDLADYFENFLISKAREINSQVSQLIEYSSTEIDMYVKEFLGLCSIWLRRPDSIKWWELIKRLPVRRACRFRAVLAQTLEEFETTKLHHHFADEIFLGFGRAPERNGIATNATDGYPALMRARGDASIREYNINELFRQNIEPPCSIKSHLYAFPVNVRFVNERDMTISYNIEDTIKKVVAANPLTVDLTVKIIDSQLQGTNPSEWYSTQFVTVPERYIRTRQMSVASLDMAGTTFRSIKASRFEPSTFSVRES